MVLSWEPASTVAAGATTSLRASSPARSSTPMSLALTLDPPLAHPDAVRTRPKLQLESAPQSRVPTRPRYRPRLRKTGIPPGQRGGAGGARTHGLRIMSPLL